MTQIVRVTVTLTELSLASKPTKTAFNILKRCSTLINTVLSFTKGNLYTTLPTQEINFPHYDFSERAAGSLWSLRYSRIHPADG